MTNTTRALTWTERPHVTRPEELVELAADFIATPDEDATELAPLSTYEYLAAARELGYDIEYLEAMDLLQVQERRMMSEFKNYLHDQMTDAFDLSWLTRQAAAADSAKRYIALLERGDDSQWEALYERFAWYMASRFSADVGDQLRDGRWLEGTYQDVMYNDFPAHINRLIQEYKVRQAETLQTTRPSLGTAAVRTTIAQEQDT